MVNGIVKLGAFQWSGLKAIGLALALFMPLAQGQSDEVADVAASADATPLNILWLTAEDMSPWIGCYGDDTVPTPNLDALAAQSIRYTAAYANAPVCAPARTALITGMHPIRIGAMHMRCLNQSPAAMAANPQAYADIPIYEAVPPDFVQCFPETLRAAGWYTTNNDKQDYQFRAPATVWDDSSRQASYRNRPVHASGESPPFFAVFNYFGTHESQAFPDSNLRPQLITPDAVPVPPLYPDTPAVRDALARTYNNIAAMDAWVGQQLRDLEEAGLAESTMVMFFSDHGVGLPRGKRSLYDTGTRVPLLVRFPENAWPDSLAAAGLSPGSTTDRLVSFVDFAPTILSLAGIEPDLRLDGRAFLGPYAAEPADAVYLQADRFDSVRERTRGVTDGRYLYLRNFMTDVPHLIPNAYRERIPMTHDLYALRDGGPLAETRTAAQWQIASTQRPEEELYDLANDPWQVRNLLTLSNADRDGPVGIDESTAIIRARAVGQALAAKLDQWIQDCDDMGAVLPESRLLAERLWPPEGEQPTTAVPTLTVVLVSQASGILNCDTPGASIGYRLDAESPWLAYDGGDLLHLRESGQASIQAQAHRIGYQPSTVVTLSLDPFAADSQTE